MQHNLYLEPPEPSPRKEIAPDAFLFKYALLEFVPELLKELEGVLKVSPYRQLSTPKGHSMSVQTSNCGRKGWISDAQGYRYTELDPLTRQPWPKMPVIYHTLAQELALQAGYKEFDPDACLINRYQPGNKMGLHQDKDERDFTQPIVSFSLGLPIYFMFGGGQRKDPCQRFLLEHGDVLVWGGESRLHYHGVSTLRAGQHPLLGAQRINLTFRCAS